MKKIFFVLIVIGTLVFASGVKAQSDLVGYWKFDEGVGTFLNDSNGNGNNGTIYGATWTTGKFGSGLHFDGVSDYVDVADKGNFDNISQITITAWFKLDQLASSKGESETIVTKKHNTYPWSSYYIEQYMDNSLIFKIYNYNKDYATLVAEAIQDNTWYHVAGVYNGTSVKLYLNGYLADSGNLSGLIFDSVNPFRIGADWSGGGRFNGTIDEVMVFNRSLSADEIEALYLEGVNYHISGRLVDTNNNTIESQISVYDEGTSNVSNSTSTDINGNYDLTIKPKSQQLYDVQFNINNSFIPNFFIRFNSLNIFSDVNNMLNYVVGNASENKIYFLADVTRQNITTYSPEKPKRVLINGTDATEISSLSELKSNTWFYDSVGRKLYIAMPNPLLIKCANVALNCFKEQAWNYQPNAWNIIKDLGINTIRVSGGIEGDVWHLNMNKYPNEWAQNLDSFLSEADSNGIKVIFAQLGNQWGTLFDIVCPEPYENISGTPISQAKFLIDQLAGNNSLNHNFLTDHRVLAWTVANEPDISYNETLNWIIEVSDYIRSKGGKTIVASPRVGAWSSGEDFHVTEPILEGHVDYLERHIYKVNVFQSIGNEYYPFYNNYKNIVQVQMINGRGTFPIEDLFLGEFGIWRGYGDDVGVSGTFTDEDRVNYYRAVLDASMDAGIKNVCVFDLFVQKESDGSYLSTIYSVIDSGGVYFPLVPDLIKSKFG